MNINGALISHSKVRWEVIANSEKKTLCGIFICLSLIILCSTNIYIETYKSKRIRISHNSIYKNIFVDPSHDYHWMERCKRNTFCVWCLFWTQTPDVDKKIISNRKTKSKSTGEWERRKENENKYTTDFEHIFTWFSAIRWPITKLNEKHDRFQRFDALCLLLISLFCFSLLKV